MKFCQFKLITVVLSACTCWLAAEAFVCFYNGNRLCTFKMTVLTNKCLPTELYPAFHLLNPKTNEIKFMMTFIGRLGQTQFYQEQTFKQTHYMMIKFKILVILNLYTILQKNVRRSPTSPFIMNIRSLKIYKKQHCM